MIDVLDAVYWDEGLAEVPGAKRRWNPLGRRGLGRREQEHKAAETVDVSERESVRERAAAVDLARRAGRLVGLGSRRGQVAEERAHMAAEASVGERRETIEAERAALLQRVQQAAAVVAGFGRGMQGADFAGGGRSSEAVSGGWAMAGGVGMGGFGAQLAAPVVGLGLEEVDRGFERDARRGY